MAARRAALESQIQQFENQDPDANAARRKSAKIIEQYKHALALEERRLMELRQRRADEDDDGEALNDQIHQAELRVMEARIAIEQALQEMETDERKEAMLEELRNANLELMQVANTIHGIEQRREEILAGGREPLREVNEVGVKQARMEYELAEHRLMRLNERLADLEDSGENVVAPLTFIRLSK
jgi:chromosome segregation ATPase